MADNNVSVKITANASGLARAVGVAQGALSSLTNQMGQLGALSAKAFTFAGINALTVSAGAAAAALVSATKAAADYGDQLYKASQRTGIAIEELSKLQYAAKLSDVSNEALGKGVNNLSRLMVAAADNAGESSRLFAKYGIAVRDASGAVRPTIDVLGDLADIFATMPEGAQKTALAAEFFGKKLGADLIPLLNAGSAGLKSMSDEAERLGLVLNSEQGKAAEAFNDNLTRLAAGAKGVAVSIGNQVIPVINNFLNELNDANASGLGFTGLLGLGQRLGVDVTAKLKESTAALAKLKEAREDLYKQNLTDGGSTDPSSLDAEIAAMERRVAYYALQNKRIAGDDEETGKKRALIGKQLAGQLSELEKLRGIAAGKVSADILKDDKARTAEQIKEAEKLRAALKSAWETSRSEAEKAGEAATKLLEKAAGIRLSASDKATALREAGLTEEEKQFADQQRAIDAQAEGTYYAAAAAAAKLDGRATDFEKYAKQSELFLDRAMKFAEAAKDADLIEEVGGQQASAVEAEARAKQAESAALQQRATDQIALINSLDAKISELQQKQTNIEITADITNAETAVANLKKQLEELSKGVTVPVSVASNAANADWATLAEAGPVQEFYRGGFTGAGSKFQPAGVVHAGEFVHRQEVVRQPGALAFLDRFNRMGMQALKGYADGGLVSRMALPALRAASAGGSTTAINLTLDGNRYAMTASNDVATALTDYVRREALRKGGRR